MKVTQLTPRAYEFACHSASCRPPTSGGTGGSSKGGSRTVTAIPAKSGAAVTYRHGGERLSGGARSKVGGKPDLLGAKIVQRHPREIREQGYKKTTKIPTRKAAIRKEVLDNVARNKTNRENNEAQVAREKHYAKIFGAVQTKHADKGYKMDAQGKVTKMTDQERLDYHLSKNKNAVAPKYLGSAKTFKEPAKIPSKREQAKRDKAAKERWDAMSPLARKVVSRLDRWGN